MRFNPVESVMSDGWMDGWIDEDGDYQSACVSAKSTVTSSVPPLPGNLDGRKQITEIKLKSQRHNAYWVTLSFA